MFGKKDLPYSPQQHGQPEQVVQFYSTLGSSNLHNVVEKDCRKMESMGWRLVSVSYLGKAGLTGEAAVAIYQK